MPRMRIGLRLPRELQVGDEHDLVRRAPGSPFGSGLFQLTPNLSRSIVASSFRPKRVPPYGSAIGSVMVAGDLDGLGVALDRDLAVDRQLVAVALDRPRLERQLRVALGVEEVGRLEVRLEVRVLDLDRRDLRGALQDAVG